MNDSSDPFALPAPAYVEGDVVRRQEPSLRAALSPAIERLRETLALPVFGGRCRVQTLLIVSVTLGVLAWFGGDDRDSPPVGKSDAWTFEGGRGFQGKKLGAAGADPRTAPCTKNGFPVDDRSERPLWGAWMSCGYKFTGGNGPVWVFRPDGSGETYLHVVESDAAPTNLFDYSFRYRVEGEEIVVVRTHRNRDGSKVDAETRHRFEIKSSQIGGDTPQDADDFDRHELTLKPPLPIEANAPELKADPSAAAGLKMSLELSNEFWGGMLRYEPRVLRR
jgi:hypothetical protein